MNSSNPGDEAQGARAHLAEAIEAVREATGWTEDEVRSVIGAVTADHPDQLMGDIGEVLEWCRDIETKAAMVGLWKMLPAGVMEIRWRNGEPACRIRPSCEVEKTAEGYAISLPGGGSNHA